MQELREAKEFLDEDVREYLALLPDSVQCPAAEQGIRGRKSSSPIEPGNRAILNCREAEFLRSIMVLAKNIKRRYDNQK